MAETSFTPTQALLDQLKKHISSKAIQIEMREKFMLSIYAMGENGERILELGPLHLSPGDKLTLTGISVSSGEIDVRF